MENVWDFSKKLRGEELVKTVEELPLSARKFMASFYPDAFVRRECLKSLGVIFDDDTSFCNLGFIPIPNSPSDVHVRIGKHVSIAPNVICVADSCANNGDEINTYRYVTERITKKADVVIEDEAWIGAGVVILPGVTVGYCAMIGAGCVMTKDAEPYGIYAGVPGRKIGDVRKDGVLND